MKTKTTNTKGCEVRATISTDTVGQRFGTAGYVEINGRVVHKTRMFAYGAHAAAELAALDWCAARKPGVAAPYAD